MLSSRYLHLHEALGLGPMWLKQSARIITSPDSASPVPPQTHHAQPRLPETAAAAPAAKPPHTSRADSPKPTIHTTVQNKQPPKGPRADVLAAVAGTTTHPAYSNNQVADTAETESSLSAVQRLWAALPATAFADTNDLHHQAAACTSCRLHGERRQALSGQGSTPAKLMVISLNPSSGDDDAKQLFNGSHGRLLDNMLAAIRLPPEQVFRTAWMRCTPRISLKPTPEEQVRCAAFIRQEFRWASPQAILLLGNGFRDPIQQWLLEQLTDGTASFIVPHPAILLRQPQLKAQAWAILQQLQHYLAKQQYRKQ